MALKIDGKQRYKLTEAQTITAGELDTTAQFSLQHDHVLPEPGIPMRPTLGFQTGKSYNLEPLIGIPRDQSRKFGG